MTEQDLTFSINEPVQYLSWVEQQSPRMTSKSILLLIVMGTEIPIKMNAFGIIYLYVFMCAYLCVCMHTAAPLHESFRGLLHTLPCQKNGGKQTAPLLQ